MSIPTPTGTCARCGKRPATAVWSSNGSLVEVAHGMYECWCRACVLDAQIEAAEAAVARLSELSAERARIAEEEDADA